MSVAELRELNLNGKVNLKTDRKKRQKEENKCMLGRNKEGLKENLTSRISPRKISFLWFHKRLKKCREKCK